MGAFFVPTPFGQNALRLGVLAGPSVLALAHRKKVPLSPSATVGVALLYLQWLPAVRAVAEAHGDPSTRLAFQAEARDFLSACQARRARRSADDKNHWEAADLAKVVAARPRMGAPTGREGQPDLLRRRAAHPARYHEWLRENAVELRRAAERAAGLLREDEALMLETGADFLDLVYESPRWRIWEVQDTDPPASNGAHLLAVGPNWFMVDTKKPTVVRYRYTPYWVTRTPA